MSELSGLQEQKKRKEKKIFKYRIDIWELKRELEAMEWIFFQQLCNSIL